jgi:hypothetical protein
MEFDHRNRGFDNPHCRPSAHHCRSFSFFAEYLRLYFVTLIFHFKLMHIYIDIKLMHIYIDANIHVYYRFIRKCQGSRQNPFQYASIFKLFPHLHWEAHTQAKSYMNWFVRRAAITVLLGVRGQCLHDLGWLGLPGREGRRDDSTSYPGKILGTRLGMISMYQTKVRTQMLSRKFRSSKRWYCCWITFCLHLY